MRRFFILAILWLLLVPACRNTVPATDADERLCPPNFAYFSGGEFVAVREGDRWPGGKLAYPVHLEPFCLARYEASQPTATADYRGDYHCDKWVPPAQVRAGVLPWNLVSWTQAAVACAQQGWRLPTFEELQFAATGGDPEKRWVFGPAWDCVSASASWFAACDGTPRTRPGITGGPQGRSDYGRGVYDLLGNVAEWTATPWDVACYQTERFSLFGGSFNGRPEWTNRQQADPERQGCWLMEDYEAGTRGEHEHHRISSRPADDGFRPAAQPGPQWRARQFSLQPRPIAFPLRGFYFDPVTGARQEYEVPATDTYCD